MGLFPASTSNLRASTLRAIPMIAAMAIATHPANAASPWKTYANARFGYSICYPADRLHPLPEADNGDGRAFTGENGATLRVWGSNNALDRTVKDERAAEKSRLSKKNAIITYDRASANWFVLSGTMGTDIFYHKAMLIEDQWLVMDLRHPRTDAATWASVTPRISGCFAPSGGTQR